MLSRATRRALAAVLGEHGYWIVGRLLAEGTQGVCEALSVAQARAASGSEAASALAVAALEAERTGHAQIVAVMPPNDGYVAPELVPEVRRPGHGGWAGMEERRVGEPGVSVHFVDSPGA